MLVKWSTVANRIIKLLLRLNFRHEATHTTSRALLHCLFFFIILPMFNHSWAVCHKSMTKHAGSQPHCCCTTAEPVVQDVSNTHEVKELSGDSCLYSTRLKSGESSCVSKIPITFVLLVSGFGLNTSTFSTEISFMLTAEAVIYLIEFFFFCFVLFLQYFLIVLLFSK